MKWLVRGGGRVGGRPRREGGRSAGVEGRINDGSVFPLIVLVHSLSMSSCDALCCLPSVFYST